MREECGALSGNAGPGGLSACSGGVDVAGSEKNSAWIRAGTQRGRFNDGGHGFGSCVDVLLGGGPLRGKRVAPCDGTL